MYACVSRARTSRKLRTSPVTLPPREARKFSNTEIVDPPFPNPRLRRGAPTRPPQNRRDPSKMTHTFFALAACLLVSFKGPFARRHAITRRKRCTFLLIRTRAQAARRLREALLLPPPLSSSSPSPPPSSSPSPSPSSFFSFSFTAADAAPHFGRTDARRLLRP